MIFYDTIYLKKETRELQFVMHYAKGFHEFFKDNLDNKFINCLCNFNPQYPEYWKFWNKSCELTEFCFKNRLHPEEFWRYAYEIVISSGEPTKTFNTFGLDWMLEGVLKKKAEDDRITPAKTYSLESYTSMNPYYLVYYKAMIKRIKGKYSDSWMEIVSEMIKGGDLHLNIIKDFEMSRLIE